MIDNGDKKDYIVEFFINVLFIAPANSRMIAGQMMNILAIHIDWQDRIYSEVKAAAKAHSTNKDAPLVEQLASIPLEAWELLFPSIDLCLKETIRMWTSFSMIRLNTSPNPIPIPGTDEVVPGNTFVSYNSTEVHFSEELYPNPTKFDPERFLEGREEFKKQAYGCEYSRVAPFLLLSRLISGEQRQGTRTLFSVMTFISFCLFWNSNFM